MKSLIVLPLIAAAFLNGCARHATHVSKNPAHLPPVPPGVSELKFGEFFVSPVGAHGLVLTDKLANLTGKRVRIAGYMVEQHQGPPGKFLFCATPVQLHDHDSAHADDLPPAVIHVTVPTCVGREVPYAPGPMLLTGVLSIGHRDEADGRMSLVRLDLDPPESFIDPRHHH